MGQDFQEQDPVVAKAMRDASFRQRLLSDPKATLQAEFGASIPPGVTIHIHEETPTDVHIVIPAETPGGMNDLSDADLEQAVGGRPGNPVTSPRLCS
jgi:hypothetical protein